MTLYAQYFFDDFNETQKLDAAHAYLMVSEQFRGLGDTVQAEKFKDMALFIYPQLILIEKEKIETLTMVPEKKERVQASPDKSNVIRYYFSKLLRSITTGDLETADSLIAERLYLPEYEGGLTKNQLAPMVSEINRKYNLSTFSPSDLYKLETIKVQKVEEGTYLLTIEGADNKYLYTSGVTFFGKIQTFQFRNFESGWKIDKISAIF
jgi:hypothetical protein